MKQPTGRLIFSAQVPEYTFVEEGYSPIPRVRLDDKEYGRGLQRFIGVCVDIVPVSSDRKVIYLAWRKQKPMVGWWWIGGGMLPGESQVEAAVRNFKRETKLEISPERLVKKITFEYLWKDRAQEPQNIGCHMVGHTFSLEIGMEEVRRICLDQNEYEENELIPFGRVDLLKAGVFPAILKFYDIVFPTNA